MTFIDVLLISILGFLVSRIFRMTLRYRHILNIAFHAVTLPVILAIIYFSVNMLTGFEIRLFRMAYDAIAYIYILTAMLIIRADMMKKQLELLKMVEVQKQVRIELEQEKQEKKEKKKENKEDKEEEGSKSKKETGETAPEGSQAIEENGTSN